ncbi:uncharacterized protein LOC132923082 isoform X2 [Rhopalosiphum padi]|uniref:uncharacterized protein LOC132923082 isoform X2 n=1 Tax=Rhopalosiphum padi TaxID=40932 RepID=UPI00298DA6D2|nr:uncharacterized protein LOC132923082 isoform X2 [Rhopalosiphum padi]
MLRMHHQMTKMNIFKHYFVTITIIVLPILIIPATSNPTYDDYLSDFDIYPGNFNKDDADILLHMAGFIDYVNPNIDLLTTYCGALNIYENNTRKTYYRKIFTDAQQKLLERNIN